MQTQKTFIDDIKHQYTHGGMTIRLIFINVIVFVAINLLLVFGRLLGFELGISNFLGNLFSLQTSFWGFITHPWALFTSIFAHYTIWHLLFNMIFLYFTGRIFVQLFNAKRLLYTYIIGGLAGGLFEIIAQIIFPNLQSVVIVGASGSIMAIFFAIAFYQPKMQVNLFGVLPVRIIILAGVFLLADLLNLGINDGTAHFAHIGGAVIGMVSIQNIHSPGNIITLSQRIVIAILQLFSSNKKPKFKVKKGGNVRHQTDDQYNENKKGKQDEINRILDKISKSGYESLTKKEKDFLFNQSKNG